MWPSSIGVPVQSIEQVGSFDRSDQVETKAETFIARRGSLVMKEFKKLGFFAGSAAQNYEMLTLHAFVFTIGRDEIAERAYGIKATANALSSDRYPSRSAFIDYEEILELMHGIAYIKEKAQLFIQRFPHYVELEYVTKGRFRVGFVIDGQSDEKRLTVFVDCNAQDTFCFREISGLDELHEALFKGVEFLDSAGAQG